MSDLVGTILIACMSWLDAAPDGLRAMLAALLLATGLAYFERRIPSQEIQYGQSFRKAALVALLLAPVFVWQVPASRMVVFVEILPEQSGALNWMATGTSVIWLAGLIVSLAGTLAAWYRQRCALQSLPELQDERLTNRLAHWRGRLGMPGPDTAHLTPGDEPRFFDSPDRLLFPAAALRWPTNQQDILIINGLCSLKQHHHRWHRLAQLVSCVYWPVTWIQHLHRNLCRDFELSASELADSCYQDRLGYDRTLRQLEQRLAATERNRSGTGKRRLQRVLQGYPTALTNLLRPTDPAWQIARLQAARTDNTGPLWKDPYDRVVLFVGQAVLIAILLTGVTLRERPPETDDRYLLPFGVLWKEHFHRNLEQNDRARARD